MAKEEPADLVPENGDTWHVNRRIRLNNAIVTRVREEGDPLATLIAEQRWLVDQMGRKDYSHEIGIHYHALMNAEKAIRNPEKDSVKSTTNAKKKETKGFPQHETYVKIYKYWKKREDISEETRNKMLELLIRRDYERRDVILEDDDELEPSVVDLYKKWSYQVGLKRFENATKAINKGKPLTYGALWQRRATGVVAEFHEVQALATRLKMNVEEAKDIWTGERWNQLIARELPEPFIDFLIRLESEMGVRLVARNLSMIDVPNDIQKKLARSEFVPFASVKNVVRKLYKPEDIPTIQELWEACESDAETFGKAFERIRDERGMTNRQLALAMNIQPPEMRGKESRGRQEAYRPSHQIREMYNDPQYSAQAPAGVLVELIAPTTLKRNQNHREDNTHLHTLFDEVRTSVYRSKGGQMDDMEMRIHREYWGVLPEELIAYVRGMSTKDILEAERGRIRITASVRRKIMKAIGEIGTMKVQAARERLNTAEAEKTAAPAGLDDFSDVLAKRVGGHAALYRAIREQAGEVSRSGIGPDTLKNIGTGDSNVILPLCSMEKISRAAGLKLPSRVEREWYLHYPNHLYGRDENPIEDPLTRGFQTTVARFSPNLRHFQNTRMTMLCYPTINRNFGDMAKGTYPKWPNVSRYLGACDVSTNDPLFIYLEALHASEGRVPSALKKWRSTADKRGLNIEKYEYTFGLTKNERKRNGVKE